MDLMQEVTDSLRVNRNACVPNVMKLRLYTSALDVSSEKKYGLVVKAGEAALPCFVVSSRTPAHLSPHPGWMSSQMSSFVFMATELKVRHHTHLLDKKSW